MKKVILIFAAVLVVGFILIQFIPYGHDHTNPIVVNEPAWRDTQTRDIAAKACFDCHSNETVWPWYSRIAPVSWLIARDVEQGRRHLNFSEWTYDQHDVGEIAEVLQYGEMPPSVYLLMHPEAKLTDAEVNMLMDGILASSAQ
jgi:hypothetical protein